MKIKTSTNDVKKPGSGNHFQLFLSIIAVLTGIICGLFVGQIYFFEQNPKPFQILSTLAVILGFFALLLILRKLQTSRRNLLLLLAQNERTQAALREPTQYENLFRHANDAIMIFEPDTEIILGVNDKACEIYRRRREDFVGRSLKTMSQDVARGTDELNKLLHDGVYDEFESVHLRGDGTAINLVINGAVIEYQGRQAILTINRDVTAKKLTEENLRESEEKFRAVTNSARDAIISADGRGNVVFWNKEAEKIFGYTEAEIIGKSLQMIMPERHAHTHQSSLERNVSTGENHLVGKTVEVPGRRKDGTEFSLELTLGTWESRDGKFFTAVMRDVTERKIAENTLQKNLSILTSTLESTADGILVVGTNNEIVAFNEKFAQMWGMTSEELNGLPSASAPQRISEQVKTNGEQINSIELLTDNCTFDVLELKNGKIYERYSQPQRLNGEITGRVFSFRDATGRLAAEKENFESRRMLQLVMDTIPQAIWWKDVNSVFLGANKYLSKIAGFTDPDKMIGLTDYDMPWTREEAIFFRSCDRRVVESGAAEVGIIEQQQQADGKQAWLNTNKVPLCNEKGEVIGVLGTFEDITDRRRADQALRESEYKLRTLFERMSEGLLQVNNDEVIEFVNDRLCEMTGYEREELLGKVTFDVIYDEEGGKLVREANRQRQKGEFDQYELRLRKKDGEALYAIVGGAPLINAEGIVTGTIGVFTDITERKRAERETSRLAAIVESSRDAIISKNLDGVIISWNYGAERLFGYAAAEIVGRHISLLFPPERLSEESGIIEKLTKGETIEQFETTRLRRDGTKVSVSLTLSPIKNAKGETIGISKIAHDITERKRAEEQLLHDAFHDGLTGLANRKLFMDYLQRAISRGKNRRRNVYAVLFLDFDRFKFINDSLGHIEGDNFLKIAAHRLERATRTDDIVARLGGDEFVVLLSDLAEAAEAVTVAERIQEDLKNPFSIGGRDVMVSASIGIALSTSGHLHAEDMLRDADIAMYRAKSKGRGGYQIFDAAMGEQAARQLSLQTEMREALERDEFEMHYQPIINLKTETITGFESLVRWRHPVRGLISPFEFIAAAEESNFILPLGSWILKESCRQMREWQTTIRAAANLTVSVNLSSKQFAQIDFVGHIVDALEESKLNARLLKLEITESQMMENSQQAVSTINELRQLGIELSLDDFGTGYSSLSYLHRLPASFLKIDRSFVTRMTEAKENAEIISTIIKLARNLKMQVIAEGIETAEQLRYLKRLNCDFGQGYFFSKPLAAKDAGDFIRNSSTLFSSALYKSVIDLETNA